MNILRALRRAGDISSADFISPSNPLPVSGSSTTSGQPFALETSGSAIVKQSIVSTACSLLGLTASNPTASAVYLKIYNKASAPDPATDTPIRTVKLVPDSDVNVYFAPKRFTLGLAIAITGAAGKTDTTTIVSGVQVAGDYL